MATHAERVLSGILNKNGPRRDLLGLAVMRLEKEHFVVDTQRNIFRFLVNFYDRTGDVMSQETFVKSLEDAEIEASKIIAYSKQYEALANNPIGEADFKWSIDELRAEQAKRQTGQAITEAMEILERGYEVGRDFYKGHDDARRFLLGKLHDIDRIGASETAPEGNIFVEKDAILEDYFARKNGSNNQGILTGIRAIDDRTDGWQRGELIMICAYAGKGKASPLWEKVLTPTGWTTMGELSVGDEVVGQNGKPTQVTHIHDRGSLLTYKVTFSDGSSVAVAGDHLWEVQDGNDRMGFTKAGRRVLSTLEIKSGLALKRRYYIPLVQPVVFQSSESLPIPAYTLGALLGDGGFTGSSLYMSCHTDDVETIENMRESGLCGGKLKLTTGKYQWILNDPRSALRNDLKHLNLWGLKSEHKFIPDVYKIASVEDRLALLRGLLDTDGSQYGHTTEFSSSSEQLARGVVEIVHSLGGTASVVSRKTTHLDSWRVHLKMPRELNPFLLSRKALRWEAKFAGPRQGLRSEPFRAIRSVETLVVEPVRCITVSAPDHLYVTKDYIVTHNSMISTQAAWHAAVEQKKNVFFATAETLRDQVMRRLLARHSRLPMFGKPTGINSKDIKNGTLSDEDEKIFKDVVEDWYYNSTYGELNVVQIPPHSKLSYVENRLNDWGRSIEVDLVIDDYLALHEPFVRRNSEREEYNDTIKAAKGIAQGAFNGKGVPFVSPWQITRDAYDHGLKNGYYTMASLSDTSEAEKSADQIIAILREEENNRDMRLQYLKMRDGELPPITQVAIDLRSTYIGTHMGPQSLAPVGNSGNDLLSFLQ